MSDNQVQANPKCKLTKTTQYLLLGSILGTIIIPIAQLIELNFMPNSLLLIAFAAFGIVFIAQTLGAVNKELKPFILAPIVMAIFVGMIVAGFLSWFLDPRASVFFQIFTLLLMLLPIAASILTLVNKNLKKHEKTHWERAQIWYDYNKQKIPFYLILIATIALTASLDFDPQRQRGDYAWQFHSHMASMEWVHWFHGQNDLSQNLTRLMPFFLFISYLLILVVFFLAFGFSKKRNPLALILINIFGITILVLLSIIFHLTGVVIPLAGIRPDALPMFRNSRIFLMLTIIPLALGLISSWFFVNWKYTNIDE